MSALNVSYVPAAVRRVRNGVKIAPRPRLEPANFTFYMLILEIKEWQNIW
jgi:hypothetical protein